MFFFTILESIQTFTPLGCFSDSIADRALPTPLYSFRGSIDWFNMNRSVSQCAAVTQSYGYQYFAVQYYGECWSGDITDDDYKRHGESTTCWEGTGRKTTNFVYKFN